MTKRKSILFMLIVILAIGFAAVSTTLLVNGNFLVGENKDDFDIIFTNASLDGINKKKFISNDKKHIEFISNELKSIDDKVTLTYEVTNTSRNYDADVQVTCTANTNEYITFSYTPSQMEVAAGEAKSGSLTASMIKVVDEDKEVPITCTLSGTAKVRESLGEEYIAPFSKSGVMMARSAANGTDKKYWAYQSNITKVEFEDKLVPHETTEELTFDVSDLQDKSVMAYLVPNGEILGDTNNLKDTTAYTLYLQGDTGIIANQDCTNMFKGFNNLLEIENLKYLDTSNVTTMLCMFKDLYRINKIDLSSFDTSNVTNMGGMFQECRAATIIDVRSFDTSNVTSTGGMFYGCNSVIELDLSNFNTSSVTDMRTMFYFCTKLSKLNVSGFDTSNVTSMYLMFGSCPSLTELNVANFNTSKVTEMGGMFEGLNNVKELDISNFDTSNVTNMGGMFRGCNSLNYLNLSKWNTEKVTSMENLFLECRSLTSLEISNFNTSNVTNMKGMFSECLKLKKIFYNFDTTKVTNMSSMFNQCRELSQIDTINFNTSQVTDMNRMFYNCNNLTNLDVSNFDTSNVVNMSNMFAYCENLEALDVSKWITNKVTDMSSMFGYLRKVTKLDVINWNTSNVTTMRAMFVECNALTTSDLSNFDLTKVTNLNSFVAGCHNLVTTITIRGTNCTNYAGESGFWSIFTNTAIGTGHIIVNYTADASDLVDLMIATKSDTSNVTKGTEVT